MGRQVKITLYIIFFKLKDPAKNKIKHNFITQIATHMAHFLINYTINSLFAIRAIHRIKASKYESLLGQLILHGSVFVQPNQIEQVKQTETKQILNHLKHKLVDTKIQ